MRLFTYGLWLILVSFALVLLSSSFFQGAGCAQNSVVEAAFDSIDDISELHDVGEASLWGR
jgi:nitrate reductase gamma subunit